MAIAVPSSLHTLASAGPAFAAAPSLVMFPSNSATAAPVSASAPAMSHALPTELLSYILTFLPSSAAQATLATLSRVNYALSCLVATHLYRSVSFGALPTLVKRPELAAFVRQACIRVDQDRDRNDDDKDNEDAVVKAECMLSILPNLESLDLRLQSEDTWPSFPFSQSKPSHLAFAQTVTSLTISFRYRARLDPEFVLRVMSLPSLTSLTLSNFDISPSSDLNLPSLASHTHTLSLTHLHFTSCTLPIPLLHTLLTLPRALESFAYRVTGHALGAWLLLSELKSALLPHASSLRSLEIISDRMWVLEFSSPDADTGVSPGFGMFPGLERLIVQGSALPSSPDSVSPALFPETLKELEVYLLLGQGVPESRFSEIVLSRKIGRVVVHAPNAVQMNKLKALEKAGRDSGVDVQVGIAAW